MKTGGSKFYQPLVGRIWQDAHEKTNLITTMGEIEMDKMCLKESADFKFVKL